MFEFEDVNGFSEMKKADDFEEKHEKEKPGIELTGYSLVFFKVVEAVLEERGKQQLTTLLQHFLNSCDGILKHCPGISAFDGPWRRESSTSLSINDAERFVDKDFFNGMTCLFETELEGADLTIAQTQQVLGTFFISSLLKLYQEVMLQRLFQTKLRNLAEGLKTHPIAPSATEPQRLDYILAIFQSNVSAYEELQENTQQQFEAIFQDLASKNDTEIVNLVKLFFLRPFPFEIIQNAHFILNHPELIVASIEPFMKRLESSEQKGLKPRQQGKNQTFIAKHATHIKTAFETLTTALKTVSDKKGIQILNKDTISNEFIEIIQIQTTTASLVKIDEQDESEDIAPIKTIGNDNFIFHQYFLAVHLKLFQENDFDDVLEASLVRKAIQAISPKITQMLKNPAELEPFLKLMSSKNPADKIVLAPKESLLHTLDITEEEDKFALRHLQYATGKRRCCNPRDRETLSALLNANPLVKALLLSQVPIAVVLQILRVNDTFKDVSTVMWFEPFLGTLGFSGGVYALRNPKTLVNTLFRTLEALSASAVVLSKCLEIAILVHTTLLPAESRSGGMDLERFLTRVASIPMALALLSLAYNSISPNFKKRCCSKGVRRAFDFINYSTIHWGLYQIIRTDIIKIVSKFETPGFSSDLDKWLFECFSAIPALVFAFTRVAPICASKRDAVGGNISETLNTAALYGFTIALGMKLIIDLYFSGSDNLPIEQTNFRRVFFPILLSASTAVMARFGRSFREFYEGNPEVIVLKISKFDTFPDSNVPLLSLQEVNKLNKALEAPLDSGRHQEGRKILSMYDQHLHTSKADNILNNKGKRTHCCVVS